jgi:hypothetical protein
MPNDSAVLHQVHPAKLGCDIAACVLSNVFAVASNPQAGLAVRLGRPLIGRAPVLRWGTSTRYGITAGSLRDGEHDGWRTGQTTRGTP